MDTFMAGYSSPADYKSSCSTDGSSEPEVMLASQNPKKPAGRKKFKVTRHPVYRGVRSRANGKWVCEVRHPATQERVWLGTHPNAEMAARAHDVAVLAMRGRSACLNFADSVWRLPVPESNDVKDIQKAAAEAAEGFRYSEEEVVVEKNDEFDHQSPENVCCMDEEQMPGFLDSMAEALMLPPPQMVEYGNYRDNDVVEHFDDISLWSY
uniref:dehydration-responsive element-binding protein 1E-like n=1 Tax=Erigeron canadensis TaxID=72917 RepID=UPI001CB8E709|nr:dehydration-responsive element-binding protein 1E-like [Erigeron canadensis]